ncbi:uroporphyrinogen decarboxylase [Flaviflexus salsibiostraticola]|uniref:uroporphyrinogen decarboxylase n=1 Tax=Flaviflexus salsibiostraticola TaxID=1282737 RepID=UPI001B880A97|nr:uroporphyrinogen decarboxylase [Flaviflexus salsibiostraticola]
MHLLNDAARGIRGERVPVWFMRQAGRSLPEYRKLRENTNMLDACLTPELAAEITMQPVRRHGVDGAVFFSDIVIPLKIAGIDVDIKPGVGPVFGRPVQSAADITELTSHTLEDSPEIREAIGICVQELDVPVLGFGGAPFTLAAYMVEGRPSRDHLGARALMHADPASWDRLMTWAADITGRFLEIQIEAGASVVQLFDSWAGSLSVADYESKVLPYSKLALERATVPTIHFGTGTSLFLEQMASCADVLGVDYRMPLDEVARRVPGKPLQGNIDPALLAAPWSVLEEHIDAVLAAGRAAPSHILNLGHGVPPTTDPDVLTRIVSYVKQTL